MMLIHYPELHSESARCFGAGTPPRLSAKDKVFYATEYQFLDVTFDK
jgi:hypothetical protein